MSKSLIVFVSLIVAVVFGLITGKIVIGTIVTALTFFAVLGVLVYIHEAGHFITARRNGMTCHEFGFGFPPRIGGIVRDEKTGKMKFIWGSQDYYGKNTLFSWNWIPLGGFVRIKEHNTDPNKTEPDEDSFPAKSVWVRFKVLIAGVVMNFLLAWALMIGVLMMGSPVPYSAEMKNSQSDIEEWIVGEPSILVNNVGPDSVAAEMGMAVGDSISSICSQGECVTFESSEDVIGAVQKFAGNPVRIEGQRGSSEMVFEGNIPSVAVEGKGLLGIQLAQMVIVEYPFLKAIGEGLKRILAIGVAIFFALGALLKGLVTFGGVGEDVAGPIGIATLVGQMRELGVVYLMNIAALLSLNLAIFNALPIPALDGGRILFVLIEGIKGTPVSPKVEGWFHMTGMTLLMLFMLYITARELTEKITG